MKQQGVGLLGHISIISDPRMDRKKLHELTDILFLSISACLCGCDTWEDIHEFAEIQEGWLRNYIRLEHGIPSADTIARVFSLIDPEQFETAFRNWVFSFYKVEEGKIIAIDGKRVRGSYGNGKAAIHMVGAFATEAGLALAQVKTEDKSNEITVIPQLLDALILKGCVVTLDAMGCQKNIVEKIKHQGGDYVISLKGNQGCLYNDVQLFLTTEKESGFKKVPHDFYETIEKGHGRIETRRYWITEQIDWLEQKNDEASVMEVERRSCARQLYLMFN